VTPMPQSRAFRSVCTPKGAKPAVFLALALLFALSAAVEAAQRSVVIIQMDSLRADHLQAYGYGRATSPNIAAFARRATVFEQAYPAASWTRPSILAMLTGRYSSELTTNMGGSAPIKSNQPTLATILRAYGYATAAFYNTAQLDPKLANVQDGFDVFADYGAREGADMASAFVGRGVDRTIDFLRSARKPAFVYFHVLDPHHPYIPSENVFGKTPVEKYRDSYSFATGVPPYDPKTVTPCYLVKDLRVIPEMVELYDSEIRLLDAEVGRLLHFIDDDPRYRDAVVVVTSDHGEEFGEHGGLFHGARFYEESLRVPLIVRDPTRPYSIGRRVPSVVSLVDVAPTILSLAGIGYQPSDFSGQSLLLDFGRRGGRPRDTVIVERLGCGYDMAVSVRRGDWKMILRVTRPHMELYNLRRDPGEKHDLARRTEPDARKAYKELYATFETWYRQVNRPLATRNGDAAPNVPDDLRARLKAIGYLN